MVKGSYVALVTPFKNGSVDYNALDNLVDFHLKSGTHGLLLLGTTAESPALASDEKERIVRFVVKKVNKRLPIMVGTGTNNVNGTISQTSKAKEWGADSALVITPYYNKPTQKGLYEYFKLIHEKTNIPIVIYNVPGRTGVNINSNTTVRLATEFERIVAIKEASGNLIQASEILRDAPKDFSLLSGEDALNMPILLLGGKGVISVTANILPKSISDLCNVCEKGNIPQAQKIHSYLLDINQKLFIETNPIPVKEALAMMKMITNEIRLPLANLQEEHFIILKDTLKKYNLI